MFNTVCTNIQNKTKLLSYVYDNLTFSVLFHNLCLTKSVLRARLKQHFTIKRVQTSTVRGLGNAQQEEELSVNAGKPGTEKKK